MQRRHTSRSIKLPTKRERKKEKKAKEDKIWPVNRANRGFDTYDPPNKVVELDDKLLEKVVSGNAMLMYGLGSRLHYQLAAFSRRDIKRLWAHQKGKCAVSGLDLYGPPGIGPGGIGIDIINYKRKFEFGNIRLVSSFFAYTRHVSKYRRFILKNLISDGWAKEYNIYDAIWTYLFKELKTRKAFKFMPVRAEIQEDISRPGSSEITFTFHITKLDSGDGRVEKFCVIRLENDYLEVLTPGPKDPEGYNPMMHDRIVTPNIKFPLSDPSICPIDAILQTANNALADRLKSYLRSLS